MEFCRCLEKSRRSRFRSDFEKHHDRYDSFTPLHIPIFEGNEKRYLAECVDSNFVSSIGEFVDRFEGMLAAFAGVKKAVLCVNGTLALHIGMKMCGVDRDDEVLAPALTDCRHEFLVAFSCQGRWFCPSCQHPPLSSSMGD